MLAMCTLGQSCINPMANLFGSQRDLLTFDDQLLTKIGMDFGGFVLPEPIQLSLPNLLFLENSSVSTKNIRVQPYILADDNFFLKMPPFSPQDFHQLLIFTVGNKLFNPFLVKPLV